MKPELVIFDCDGVLVDSEVISCRVSSDFFTELGFPVSQDEVMQRYLGRSVAFMLSDMQARHERALPDDIEAALHERVGQSFARDLQAIDGIADAIARISYATCVASSGTHQRIERSLRITQLYETLQPHIFSATQVVHGKPAPDLFLFAAKQMSIAPERCVVIEDSVAGVQAGHGAGMRVIGFTGGSHCRPGHETALRDAGAGEVIAHMRELPDRLA
jgi:HAD superfamily hydrolase (TIGR01509 family)